MYKSSARRLQKDPQLIKKPIASKLAFVTELLKSSTTGRSSKGEKFDSIESSLSSDPTTPDGMGPHQMIKGFRGPFLT